MRLFNPGNEETTRIVIRAIFTPKGLLILVLGAVVVAASVLMLWSELNFTGSFPEWIAWLAGPLGVSNLFNDLSKSLGTQLTDFLKAKGAEGSVGDYGYMLFMFGALCLAAVAIMIIGKEDAEEKTVLPSKK